MFNKLWLHKTAASCTASKQRTSTWREHDTCWLKILHVSVSKLQLLWLIITALAKTGNDAGILLVFAFSPPNLVPHFKDFSERIYKIVFGLMFWSLEWMYAIVWGLIVIHSRRKALCSMSQADASLGLFIEQDGNQFNDLWLAMAVIFGVMVGFFLGVFILFVIRRNFPAMYTKVSEFPSTPVLQFSTNLQPKNQFPSSTRYFWKQKPK